MRILHVIPQFPYFGGRTIIGGHASCLLALSCAQHRAGQGVTILSHVQGHEGWREIEGGPRVYSVFAEAKTRTVTFGLMFCRAVVNWAFERRDSYDVIHVHSGYSDYFMVSARLRTATGKPTVHTLYCPIPRELSRARVPVVRSFIRRWGRDLDWCGGISANVQDSLRAYGIRGAERVLPAVDYSRFQEDRVDKECRSRFGLAETDRVILFVGNAKRQKNAIGVVRAVHQLTRTHSGLKLVVTTELRHSSSDRDLTLLNSEIRDLGLDKSVVRLGIVEDMPSLIGCSDVVVAPFFDTFGPSDYFIVALEAMACGKPVVVSAVGGMPEVVTPEVGRLVDPHSVSSIAAGLRELLDADPAERAEMGRRGRAVVETLFDPNQTVEAYDAVYRSVS